MQSLPGWPTYPYDWCSKCNKISRTDSFCRNRDDPENEPLPANYFPDASESSAALSTREFWIHQDGVAKVFQGQVIRAARPAVDECKNNILFLLSLAEQIEGVMNSVKKPPENFHSAYLGPYHAKYLGKLGEILSKEVLHINSIEADDGSGHQVGRWKFGLNSLRHHYGNLNIIGFEFRASTDETLTDLISTLASGIQDWVDYDKAPEHDAYYQSFHLSSKSDGYDMNLVAPNLHLSHELYFSIPSEFDNYSSLFNVTSPPAGDYPVPDLSSITDLTITNEYLLKLIYTCYFYQAEADIMTAVSKRYLMDPLFLA